MSSILTTRSGVILIGVPDYDVLVAHNDYPWRPHRASISLDGPGKEVFDLASLKRAPPGGGPMGATFSLSLDSGDGRLYLAGNDAAVDAARAAVLRRRCDQGSAPPARSTARACPRASRP